MCEYLALDKNWDDPPTNWYLRLFFFKYEYNQQLYYCIADILEKDSTDLTDTNKMHKATLQTNAIARSLVVLLETPTAEAASRLTSVGFLLPKAKSISGIADVQDEGISLPLPIQCV